MLCARDVVEYIATTIMITAVTASRTAISRPVNPLQYMCTASTCISADSTIIRKIGRWKMCHRENSRS